MNIIPQVLCAMQTVLTTVADVVACATFFIKRQRKLTGASFVQTLVFGWLSNPKATLEELSQTAATVGKRNIIPFLCRWYDGHHPNNLPPRISHG